MGLIVASPSRPAAEDVVRRVVQPTYLTPAEIAPQSLGGITAAAGYGANQQQSTRRRADKIRLGLPP